MTQAATLDTQQLQRVLDYLKTRRHYQRNRVMLLLTHWSMLRVGEVAALRYCDVVDSSGQILARLCSQRRRRRAIRAGAFGLTSVCVRSWQRMWQHTSRNTRHSHCFTRSAQKDLRPTRSHTLSIAFIKKLASQTHHHIRAGAVGLRHWQTRV